MSAVNLFLDSMAKEARNILSQMCPDYIQLNQQVSLNQHLISHFSVHGNTCMPGSETSARTGREVQWLNDNALDYVLSGLGWSPGRGHCCVLGQDT